MREAPAAFGRLCVETVFRWWLLGSAIIQPPSGGCVLKPSRHIGKNRRMSQPPSGGCVLKPICSTFKNMPQEPAAFGRLCVETLHALSPAPAGSPAAFGRLCVETKSRKDCWWYACSQPPSGGCVLKHEKKRRVLVMCKTSRLRAAVC